MNNKVALVTGASRGIGQAIAVALHEKGYQVVGVSRSIQPAPHLAMAIPSDVSEIHHHEEVIKRITDRFGRIDLLVNNAGVAPLKREDMLVASPESFDRLMDINLRGPFFLTRRVVNSMLGARERLAGYHPVILFITSVSAVTSSPERAEYCVSKAGLSMAAQLFADRLTREGIPVYEIRPGVILTDMTKPVKEKYDRLIADGLIPEGRMGTPEEVARAVVTLAGGEIPYATGAIIEMSGGMNIRHL